jgi:hypothetical protein
MVFDRLVLDPKSLGFFIYLAELHFMIVEEFSILDLSALDAPP